MRYYFDIIMTIHGYSRKKTKMKIINKKLAENNLSPNRRKDARKMQNTVTAGMARWAEKLEYEHLSPEAIHQAKRFMLDSIGCALGGFQQHDLDIARSVLDELAGKGPATVIGSGEKLDVVSAALVNALLIRSMDYNAIY